ncbi:hypothetical protein RhiirB3_442170 [Rhizophagus irregularis]|nr:hypothetical protein RhiirB3_442170 [Rhizophagus irregularis]
MSNSNNIREGFSCGYPQNGNCFQQPINILDSLQNPQNSQNSALFYPSSAQQFGQNETNQQILSQQNNGIPIIPQSQNNFGSPNATATHDNYAVIPDQQFCCPQHNHHHPVTSPQMTFTHEVPGYTVMLTFIPNHLNMQNQQSQQNGYLNNYLNNHR